MAINITASTSSAKLQQPVQQQPRQQPAAAKQAEEATKAKEAKQAQQANKPEQPKPVVNAQGQTTGKVINITA